MYGITACNVCTGLNILRIHYTLSGNDVRAVGGGRGQKASSDQSAASYANARFRPVNVASRTPAQRSREERCIQGGSDALVSPRTTPRMAA